MYRPARLPLRCGVPGAWRMASRPTLWAVWNAHIHTLGNFYCIGKDEIITFPDRGSASSRWLTYSSIISNSYITHAAFTYAERKTALNWRFGTLWSNKMAYRYQFSNTSKCPLRGEPNGGEHISGGCRHASMERIARHHHTGRILLITGFSRQL